MGTTFNIHMPSTIGFAENQDLFFEEPPLKKTADANVNNGDIERLVRKFDPAERDSRNRTPGRQGEELVFNFERNRLLKTNSHLVEKVR